jgi:hypothetical protein
MGAVKAAGGNVSTIYVNRNPRHQLFYGVEFDQWRLVEPDGKTTIPNPDDLAIVLQGVLQEFALLFGAERIDGMRVDVLPCINNPVSFPRSGLIFLSARGVMYDKYVYQFSHELFHLIVAGQFSAALKWFEEALCEMASFFFLRKMRRRWEVAPPYPHWKDYAQNYDTYASKTMAAYVDTDFLSDFVCNLNAKKERLKTNSVDRRTNAQCAIKMLPVFEAHEELWLDLLRVGALDPNESFEGFLIKWLEASEQKGSVESILELYGVPCSRDISCISHSNDELP